MKALDDLLKRLAAQSTMRCLEGQHYEAGRRRAAVIALHPVSSVSRGTLRPAEAIEVLAVGLLRADTPETGTDAAHYTGFARSLQETIRELSALRCEWRARPHAADFAPEYLCAPASRTLPRACPGCGLPTRRI